MYALKNIKTGKLVGFTTTTNINGDFCEDITYTLELNHIENIWVTTDKKTAKYVANHDTPYYNAGFDSPKNPWAGELEVVKLTY